MRAHRRTSLYQQRSACLTYLGRFLRWEVDIRTAALLWDAASRICSKQHAVSLCHFHLFFFSRSIALESRRCNHIVVQTRLLLTRIPVLFIGELTFPYDRWPINSSPCLSHTYVYIAFSRWDIDTEVCMPFNVGMAPSFLKRMNSVLSELKLIPMPLAACSGYVARIRFGRLFDEE